MRQARIYIVMLLVLLLVRASGQETRVTAKLDTAAMLIGDHVGMTLEFTGPANARVLWPFLPDTILGSITVIGRGKIDTVYSGDKRLVTYTQAVNLTCYDSGFYTIPSIPFKYRLIPDTTARQVITNMTLLAVHTVKVDTTQAIKPIAGPLKVPLTLREMLPWILAGLALLALVVATVWYIRKRRKREPVFNLKLRAVLPPHEQALQEFEALRLKKMWQAGKVKEYHSELTEILRRYIEERFRVPALEQTTAEITVGLVGHPECPAPSLDKLGTLLMMADMVKFAKAQPLAADNEQCLTSGIAFVNETIPVRNV